MRIVRIAAALAAGVLISLSVATAASAITHDVAPPPASTDITHDI